MINQTTNIANKNIFAPFINKNGANYAISKPFTPDQREEFEAKENIKTHKLGMNIAVTSLIAGFGVLVLMKGLPKGSYEKVSQLFVELGNKISKNENKHLNLFQSVKLQTLKGARFMAGLVKASYNIGLKDLAIKKGLSKVPFGAKFESWITGVFTNISIKTLTKSYARTSASLDHMLAVLDRISPELLEKPLKRDGLDKKASELVKELTNKIVKHRDTHFSETVVVNQRLKRVNAGIEHLDEDVWASLRDTKKLVKNKDTYQTFIAEEIAAPAKLKLAQDVDAAKQLISHDIHDTHASAKIILSNINAKINPTDSGAQQFMTKIRNQLKEYKSLGGDVEKKRRPRLNEEIGTTLRELTGYLQKKGMANTQITGYADELKQALATSKKGAIQELLTVYKQVLPEKEYLKVEKEVYKFAKSLNTSTNMETDLLFDKFRDLKLGSAPHDTLSILAALGIVGWGLGKAKNGEERTSVALKYGVPVVGSVATTLYCTARLVSGGKSILLGILSGIAINKLGEMLDDTRKKYNKNPIDLNQLKLPELKLPDLSLNEPSVKS